MTILSDIGSPLRVTTIPMGRAGNINPGKQGDKSYSFKLSSGTLSYITGICSSLQQRNKLKGTSR